MAIEDLSANIRRYMKVQDKTAKSLAEACGISQVAMSRILNGKAEPRSSTLLKICQALNQSPDRLLADSRELQSIHFRSNRNMSAKERAAREILISEIETWIDDYRELEAYFNEDDAEKLPDYSHFSPEEAAVKIREMLKIEANCPIGSVLSYIEQLRIMVKLLPFGMNKMFGFSLDKDHGGPAIFINTNENISIERQIFTAAHELGHLLLHFFEKDMTEERSKQKEDEANQFASEFLMPSDTFIKEWERLEGFDWRERVLEIKKVFRISYKTVLKRIADLLSPDAGINVYKEFAKWYKVAHGHDLKYYYEPDPLRAEEEPGGFGESISRAEYGRYQALVKRALKEEYITTSRAAEMLGVSLVDMDELISSWDLPLEKS